MIAVLLLIMAMCVRAGAQELEPSPSPRPPVSAVVSAAYRAAALDDDPAPGWRTRARLAALVPTVTVRDGRDATWKDLADPTIGYVSVFSVAATWKLDRLVFDPNELRIATIEAARRRERRQIAAAVIAAYHAWQRTGSDEAAAELDALTDGQFTELLAKSAQPH